jgi:TatD DNase family protein
MIDLHCHLDLYPHPEDVVARAVAEGIYVLAVTTTPRSWHGTTSLVSSAQRMRVAVGLHPELVADRHQEVDLLCELLPHTRYVGEVGLDGSLRHRSTLAQQRKVLDRILDACAARGGRIISLHSRGATTPLLDALQEHPAAGTPVLHWFSGTRRELERAIDCGCWFSVGLGMLAGNKGRQIATAMPRDRVLTETDGPFASKGKVPLMPWDVKDAERELAKMWGLSAQQTETALLSNLRRLVTGRDAVLGT